jgi:hypothetical protein
MRKLKLVKSVLQLAKTLDVHPAIIMFPESEAKAIEGDF